MPAPTVCELYHVNRDALFSFHKLSESFLQKLMGLYTSAHYKNSPNDLQMLSDAPAHSVFVLLSPTAEENSESLPDILAVVQVAMEGKISRKAVEAQLARGHRSAGDLIPWTVSQQFGDSSFAQLSEYTVFSSYLFLSSPQGCVCNITLYLCNFVLPLIFFLVRWCEGC